MWKIFVFLLVMPVMSYAGEINCNDIHQGIFKTHGLYSSLNTIIRTEDKQVEIKGRSAVVLEYDICWTSDCSFMLYNRKIVRGRDSLLQGEATDTIYNVVQFSNGYFHSVISSVKGDTTSMKVTYFNIDTTRVYRELHELDKLSECVGPTGGGTFLGYNYAVSYKQHSPDDNDYTIVFLEALPVGKESRFKLLDYVSCTVEELNGIAISNCRYNGKYDNEIIALYCSDNEKEEAMIIKAWRFNKLSLRIEEVKPEKVQYKEEDRLVPMWEE